MHFALALAIAVSFWGERGVTVPCHPAAVTGADRLVPYNQASAWQPMGADPATCTIYLNSAGSAFRHIDPAFYCQAVTHEVGHIAGLQHTPAGIMRGDRSFSQDAPYGCVHWRKFAKTHHMPLRR